MAAAFAVGQQLVAKDLHTVSASRRDKPGITELHIYATGGHAYAMRNYGNPVNVWPDRLRDWLRNSDWRHAPNQAARPAPRGPRYGPNQKRVSPQRPDPTMETFLRRPPNRWPSPETTIPLASLPSRHLPRRLLSPRPSPMLRVYLLLLCLATAITGVGAPNFIVIFTDDQGYNDAGCYGSPLIRTPRLDRMAAEGVRFTDFYVAAPVCSASRASLLTGRYPDRHGTPGVYFPGAAGLDPAQTTIAEHLRPAGYATALFGKWHLGDLPTSLPTHHGFDHYFGIPYSNDMFIGPEQAWSPDAVYRDGWDAARARADQRFVAQHLQQRAAIWERGLRDQVPLLHDEAIVEYPADQATLTQRCFAAATRFIDQAHTQNQPFFVLITPAMPHVPLFASERFAGTSARGLYGDTVEEIDWHVGALLDHLDATGLSADTVVLFTSDNGPWLGKGDDAGSAAPLRDGKFTPYEGGMRVPAILRWPGHVPAGAVSTAIVSTIDLLPTLAAWAGSPVDPANVDGVDLRDHLADPSRSVDRDALYYLVNGQPRAVRVGDWKYLPSSGERQARPDSPPELYNLSADPGEQTNLAAADPARVEALHARIERFAQRLGSNAPRP